MAQLHGCYAMGMQGIEGHVRERLLLERIEQLQAEHKRAEEADKTAKEQAFRCKPAIHSVHAEAVRLQH